MNNNYYRLVLTSSGQSIYGSPVYNNLNFPNLEPYRFCKIFVESCGLSVAENDGGTPPAEYAHDYISIELQDFKSSNTQICNGTNTTNSSIIDIICGTIEADQGSHNIVKCNKHKASDIINDASIFPINVLQNNSISLNIRYGDGVIIQAPVAPHNNYKIILGIQLIE